MKRLALCMLVGTLAGTAPAHFRAGPSEVTGLAVTPDGRTLVVAGMDGYVRLLDLSRRSERANVLAHQDGVWAMGLSGDGRHFITGGADQAARVWELARVKEIQTYDGHAKPVSAVALSPDGRLAASGDYSGAVHLWDVADAKVRFRQAVNTFRVTGLAFSPDGKLLAGGGTELGIIPGISGWTTASRLCLWRVIGGSKEVFAERAEAVQFLPGREGLMLAGSTFDSPNQGRTLSRNCGSQTIRLDPWYNHRSFAVKNHYHGIAVSPEGRYVATSWGSIRFHDGFPYQDSPARGIHLWELASGKEVWIREVKREDAGVMVVTPDGRTLIAGRRRGTLVYHDLRPEGWRPPAHWSEIHFAHAWRTLGGDNPAKAYTAMWDLVACGDNAVRWLRQTWKPFSQDERVRRLLAELNSDHFAVREKARQSLEEGIEEAEPILRASLEKPVSAEVKRTVQRLLTRLDGPAPPARLRQLRVLTVLERIGTRQARGMLQELGKGAGGVYLGEQARLAETRLAARALR